jgi:hypothetical protein
MDKYVVIYYGDDRVQASLVETDLTPEELRPEHVAMDCDAINAVVPVGLNAYGYHATTTVWLDNGDGPTAARPLSSTPEREA